MVRPNEVSRASSPLNSYLTGPNVVQEVVDIGVGRADVDPTVQRLEKVL